MTKINVVDYWPFWKTPGKLRRFDYTAVDDSMPPLTVVFAYDKGTDSMLYIDYDSHLEWKDTWYIKHDPINGVMEWRDDYPGKKVVMSPGIGWGNVEEIGGSYINYPKMSPFQSWPPAISKGVQCVSYEILLPNYRLSNGKKYDDVLVMTYLQSWSGKPGGGARYWMAKGIGPIAVQWIAQNPTNPYSSPLIQTAVMDAVVTDIEPQIS